MDDAADNNLGPKKRAVFTKNRTEVGLVGVPLCDVFNMDKLLLDVLEIKGKVALNIDAFVLMGDICRSCKVRKGARACQPSAP